MELKSLYEETYMAEVPLTSGPQLPGHTLCPWLELDLHM